MTTPPIRTQVTCLCALTLATALVACSSSSPGPGEASHDSGPKGADSGDASSGNPPILNAIGSGSSGPFKPVFAGYLHDSGSCQACPGLPAGTYPGPEHYDETVIVITDDPEVGPHCAADAAVHLFDWSHYHYVTVNILSSGSLTPGTYPLTMTSTSLGANPDAATGAAANESCPDASGCTAVYGTQGSVVVDTAGKTISGTFSVEGAVDGGKGHLTGSFDASACPGMATGIPVPCTSCPIG